MPESDDITLLRQYAEGNSEAAFAALVERYVNLVYSTALRRAGTPEAADEITQAVFILLAKKASAIGDKTILSGWLYHTTQLTAANFLRGEIRRQRREQEAHVQSVLNEPQPTDEAWRQIAPQLEDAMARLGTRDRDAIVLRFFENKNLREVGAALGASEDAAKVRVSRALEKLRKIFATHGVKSTTAVISGVISVKSVHAAPAALVKTISTVAIAKGTTAGTSTLALVKGVLKVMAWTKAKTAVAVGVGVLLAAGTTTVAVKEIKQKVQASTGEDDSWRVSVFDSKVLAKAKPQVRILPATQAPGGYGSSANACMGIGASVKEILTMAYQHGSTRTIFPSKIPGGRFDFIAKLPPGSNPEAAFAALQDEVKKQFGLMGHVETRDEEVLILTTQNKPRPGLKKPAQQAGSFSRFNNGELSLQNRPVSALADYLEGIFQRPVVDHTGLTDNYDMTLKWNEWKGRNLGTLKNTLSEQFGLELVKGREPIEMLVVEKVN